MTIRLTPDEASTIRSALCALTKFTLLGEDDCFVLAGGPGNGNIIRRGEVKAARKARDILDKAMNRSR